MAEYIDRDLLKRAVHASDLENREKMALLTCISSIPAADVEPVRHGRWEALEHYRDGGTAQRCNQCKELMCLHRTTPKNYCPNCGAKMDEEEKT